MPISRDPLCNHLRCLSSGKTWKIQIIVSNSREWEYIIWKKNACWEIRILDLSAALMTAMSPTVNMCAIWDAELSSLRLADVFGFLKHCSVLEFYMADLNNWNLEIFVFWLLIDDETFQWVVDGDLFDITWHGLRVCEIHLNTCSLMYIAMFVHDLQLNSVYVKSMSTNLNWHKLTRGSFPWIAFVHHLCQDLQIKTSVSSNKTWICLRNPNPYTSLYISILYFPIDSPMLWKIPIGKP
jgi:hypothetical protein